MDTFKIVKLRQICPDRNQPRKTFDEDSLYELSESIKEYGLIEPIIVQEKNGFYIIVAGERRWRACKLADLLEVPVIIREYSPRQAAEVSIVENVQRNDLNPIEEALGYKRLQEEFGLTQEIIASKVGKSRVYITNTLRMLKLHSSLYQYLISGEITPGHARLLLEIKDPQQQIAAANKVVQENMSNRELEEYIKGEKNTNNKMKKVSSISNLQAYREAEEVLRRKLMCRVNIVPKSDVAGDIKIHYSSVEELNDILDAIHSRTNPDSEDNDTFHFKI